LFLLFPDYDGKLSNAFAGFCSFLAGFGRLEAIYKKIFGISSTLELID